LLDANNLPVVSIVVVGSRDSLGNHHMSAIPHIGDEFDIYRPGEGHYSLRVKDVHRSRKAPSGTTIRPVDEALVFVTIESVTPGR
jgi:hypothetical protein